MPGLSGVGAGLNLAGDAAGLIEGGVQLFSNIGRQKKDERALANLKRPFDKVQDEYFLNQKLAAGEAQQGLPESTKNYLTQQGQTGLSTALQYLKEAGGSPDDISKLFSTYAGSIASTGAADAELHNKNIQYYMDANKDLAGEKTKSFVVNELQPYEEKLAQLTQNVAADKANQTAAGNQIVGSLTAAGTSLSNAGLNNSTMGANNAKANYYNQLFKGSPFSIDNIQSSDIA